jgi:DNA-binding transcriptional ArsR family regulator
VSVAATPGVRTRVAARRGKPVAYDVPRGATPPLSELQKSALRAARLLKAMSNPARLVILCQLADGERSVGDLERAVGLSQSGISQHLAVLRRERVVSYRRIRQTVLYALASRDVVALMATLHGVFCGSGAKAKRAGSA